MRQYVILTDSSCDLPAGLAQDMELSVLPLTVLLDEKTYVNYLDERELSSKHFYAQLRAGKPAVTSAVNVEQFANAMEECLQKGLDVLYLGFSSGLSGTYSAGAVAAQELSEKYPEAKVYAVDTLCASLGQGLMVTLAVQEKRAGKTIEEVRDFVEAQKLHMCHWVTVDDLHHLKRGGRVSAASAVLGSALNIKPIIHVDEEGRLTVVGKVRGRKNSLHYLLDRMKETVTNPQEQLVYISHGDCEEDARYLGDKIKEELHVKDVLLNTIGPVIGAHSGPGTIALFFLGTHR